MQWSDVTKAPSRQTLRQFGVLGFLVFVGAAAWRVWQGDAGGFTALLAGVGLAFGVAGVGKPEALRLVFTGWMMLAFPIGWLVSRVALAILFYGVFTPMAIAFKLGRRDALGRRRQARTSFWTEKPRATNVRDYFRQF